MENVGWIVILVVWFVVKVWLAYVQEEDKREMRRERRDIAEADRIEDLRNHRRRMMYARMYKEGRLYEIMDEVQVEDFCDDFFRP
jgi:hypothetical protein